MNYSTESVEKAIKDTGMSLRKAAVAFGVPVATLGRKKNLDPGETKSKTGPGTVLSDDEEKQIVTWILHRAEIGAPVTKNELLDNWRKCVPKWKNEQSETSVTKENFPLVLQYTLDNMPNAENVVQSGFRGSGLYPFDSKAVNYNVLNKGKKSKQKFENNDIFKANEVTEEQRFLQEFEKNLQEELLLDFYVAASSGSWRVMWRRKLCLIIGYKFTRIQRVFKTNNYINLFYNYQL